MSSTIQPVLIAPTLLRSGSGELEISSKLHPKLAERLASSEQTQQFITDIALLARKPKAQIDQELVEKRGFEYTPLVRTHKWFSISSNEGQFFSIISDRKSCLLNTSYSRVKQVIKSTREGKVFENRCSQRSLEEFNTEQDDDSLQIDPSVNEDLLILIAERNEMFSSNAIKNMTLFQKPDIIDQELLARGFNKTWEVYEGDPASKTLLEAIKHSLDFEYSIIDSKNRLTQCVKYSKSINPEKAPEEYIVLGTRVGNIAQQITLDWLVGKPEESKISDNTLKLIA